MPYIKPDRREELGEYEHVPLPQTPGELNYVLTRLTDRVLGPSPSYEDINSAIGALECCQLELYRRVASPYEDRKMAENGDTYLNRE